MRLRAAQCTELVLKMSLACPKSNAIGFQKVRSDRVGQGSKALNKGRTGTHALTRSASAAALAALSSSAFWASRSCCALRCLSLSFSADSGFRPREMRSLQQHMHLMRQVMQTIKHSRMHTLLFCSTRQL